MKNKIIVYISVYFVIKTFVIFYNNFIFKSKPLTSQILSI